MTPDAMTPDAITLEVVTQALTTIVREMRATVFKTARSVAIYEGKDFSCGLFDGLGQAIAQSEDIAGHVVPLPWHVRASLTAFRDDLAPGDVVMLNDPYLGGTHLNDVTLVRPIFIGGRLAFMAAVREHWADVGGTNPGSLSGAVRDIYQEGLRIPPIKIVDQGRKNVAALEVLFANMRVRDEREGDFLSGLLACQTAESRLEALLKRYPLELVDACIGANLARSERRMREAIASLQDGEYVFEDYLETFPDGVFTPLRVPLRLTIAGDSLTADFTGASPQAPVPVNSTLAVTTGGVLIVLKAALDPTAALNQGSFRPITVVAPEASVVNVSHPAPAGSHGELRKRVMATMIGALAQSAPGRVTGDVHRTSFHNMIGGFDAGRGKEFVYYEWGAGGNGGFDGGDGPSAMAAVDWGDLNTIQSTEVIEASFPLFVEESQIAVGTGGAGAFRGGDGLRRRIRILGDDARYSVLADGAILPAFGIEGGGAAKPVEASVTRGGRHITFDTPGKVGGFVLRKGDVVNLRAAGGGGFGDALDRDPELVRHDVAEGLLTAIEAHETFGVILAPDGLVDTAATTARREALHRSVRHLIAARTDAPLYRPGAMSERRMCPLHPTDAEAFGVTNDDVIEVSSGRGAPLRAWVTLDVTVHPGTVPLDPAGCAILLTEPGARLAIRPLTQAQESTAAIRTAAE